MAGRINMLQTSKMTGMSSREVTSIWMSAIPIWPMLICGENTFLIGSFTTKFWQYGAMIKGGFRQSFLGKIKLIIINGLLN